MLKTSMPMIKCERGDEWRAGNYVDDDSEEEASMTSRRLGSRGMWGKWRYLSFCLRTG
jgi:hypothetical protein